ncbi:uncharacterized protein PV09_01599 [Verruconis gallopava]|uniref:PX domain-containing protein n=1 Tax=Verruconis gallopava TaxID=253628 RepID=A0A0D2B8R8_9PEZI|nr:uncharacterized protein PV09_01599 [Verruconis gallopava]KIW07659.1 hypothetical protein PV09_01599 [Verruconis gallopava]
MAEAASLPDRLARLKMARAESSSSYNSIPKDGAMLTGKQEHYLKRELISQQVRFEINELSSPTALQRFGAPFRGDKGEVAPQDSELPLLRYMFVHHVRTFPFLNQAKEKEFWQDRVQTFLESFATKQISSSDDRLEESKRRKLAKKAEKLVEIMMVSGIPTSSGYEERIRFSEMEVVDRGAQEQGLVANTPEGHPINGWDVNIAGVRMNTIKKRFGRSAHEGQYIIRVKTADKPEHYVIRTYDDFKQMHSKLRVELAGKVLPPLPKRNSSDYVMPSFIDDSESMSSFSSEDTLPHDHDEARRSRGHSMSSEIDGLKVGSYESSTSLHLDRTNDAGDDGRLKPEGFRAKIKDKAHKRQRSIGAALSPKPPGSPRLPGSPKLAGSPRGSSDALVPPILFREAQRVSLRASLRILLQNQHIARSRSMQDFLLKDPVQLNDADRVDLERRKAVDDKRIEEQRRFYEIASKRAAEVDVHMERFRRDIIESNGLRKLFASIKQCNSISELPPEHKKVAEWLRIEVAATIYHLFLAEDNSAELFNQLKRIHSLFPYTIVKNVMRFANPMALFPRILDIFMAQPFGNRSLLQHMFGMAIQEGIHNIQKSVTVLITQRIHEPDLPQVIQRYVEADDVAKAEVKSLAFYEDIDIVYAILKKSQDAEWCSDITLSHDQMALAEEAHAAWRQAVENVGSTRTAEAELYAHLKQLMKLYIRQRDKVKMLEMINEPNTIRLLRNLLEIFYEPIMRVIKAANVYNSVSDLSSFVDDIVRTVEEAQRQGFSADPNQTVQAFIDLCARHEEDFYKFVHEMHKHDNGLFDALMGHIEGVLDFLRKGPKGGSLDMNGLMQQAVEQGVVDYDTAIKEINALIKWHIQRKRWHQEKTRQKMAEAENSGASGVALPGFNKIKPSDFGVEEEDLDEFDEDDDSFDSEEEEEQDGIDGILAEQKLRARQQRLKSGAGEPQKPEVKELNKLMDGFLVRLRAVLSE